MTYVPPNWCQSPSGYYYDLNFGTTPDRYYYVVLDGAIPNRQQNIFQFTQQNGEIVYDKSLSYYVEQDASGELAPLCLTRDVASIRSAGDPNKCIYPISSVNTSHNWTFKNQYSPLPFTTGGSAPLVGDPFCDVTVNLTDPNSSFGFDVTNPVQPEDISLMSALKPYNYTNLVNFINSQGISTVRISPVHATQPMQNNRGFAFRLSSDAVTLSSPSIYAIICFGAPVAVINNVPYGGQYALVLRGDGTGTLYGFNQKDTQSPITGSIGLGDFRWCRNGEAMNTHHYFEVTFGLSGGKGVVYILSEQADVNYKKGFPNTSMWSGDTQNRLESRSITKIPLLSYLDVFGSATPYKVLPYDVGPGPVVLLLQDDLRVLSQVLNLVYAQNNYLVTGVISIPFADFNLRGGQGSQNAPSVEMFYYSRALGKLSINDQSFLIGAASSDGSTQYPITYDSQTNLLAFQVMNTSDIGFRLAFTMPVSTNPDGSGDYKSLVRIGAQYTNTIANINQNSIFTDNKNWFMVDADFSTMPEEIQSETGSIHLQDLTGQYTRLHTRGFFPVSIFSGNNVGYDSVIFQGYLANMQNLHHHSPDPCYDNIWREYNGTLVGEWYRLQNTKVPFGRITLTPDPSQLGFGNEMIGFKITDIVRNALGWAGYTPDEVDVPDDPLRFTASNETDINDQIVQPLQPILQFITHLLKNWLGWFLYFDANASKGAGLTRGIWRVFAPPNPSTFRPLAIFSTDAAEVTIYESPSEYLSLTSLPTAAILNVQGNSTFVSYTSPPEANALCLITLGGQAVDSSPDSRFHILNWVYNFESFNFNPATPTANIDSPDYLPYRNDMVIVDPQLGSQQAVDLLLRRYSDFVLHAQKFVSFVAPLVLVMDPRDPFQIAPRPLKFYDVVELRLQGIVTIGLIKSVKIHLTGKSVNTLATYEILIPNVNVGYTGGLGGNNGS